MRLAARSTVVAICLGIVAFSPTAVSARPFEPIQTVHVEPPATRQVQTAVPPILGKTQAAEQAASELAKAHARNEAQPTGTYSASALNGYGSAHPVSVQVPQAPSANPDNAFDWGDAAIGAAAALALTLLLGGGWLVLSHRRSGPSESTNVATG